MNKRAYHFWLGVRLLVLHMCTGGSFEASGIIICKDEGLSGKAARLEEQHFYLPPPLLQSFHFQFSSPFWHSFYAVVFNLIRWL